MNTVVIRKDNTDQEVYGLKAVDLATILTDLARVADRHTPFSFRLGYTGDMLHDAVSLYHLNPGAVRYWLVRDLGTHLFESLSVARQIQCKNFPQSKLFKLTRGQDGTACRVKFDGVST